MPSPNEEQKLKILFVSAEVVPFAKEGGLADVAGALPKAVADLGCDIRTIMPLYGSIKKKKYGIKKVSAAPKIKVAMGESAAEAEVYSTKLPDSDTKVFMLGNKQYFGRDGVYNNPDTGEGYPDNAHRFIFFQKAVMEFLRKTDWRPDVIHCNDHHTGLIPYYLKKESDDPLHGVAGLFSIHNLAYQGTEPPNILPIAEIPEEQFYPVSPFEFYGKVNMMKVGIVFADLISTVSPTYAHEIQSGPEYGFGLEGVLRSRASDLTGIVNGIDYSVWNPEVDKLIPFNYSAFDPGGKAKNKAELLRRSKLPSPKGRSPLIGIISRIVEQKGFDILSATLDEIMESDVQMIILGTGKREYHELYEAAAKCYPDKLSVNLKFDNELAHLIEAGSDMFLMPSRYEPCGLNQLYSLKYGTIPIVRATGGLADTIKDFDEEKGGGTGFVFKEYTPGALLGAIKRAVRIFREEATWKQLIRSAMVEDFSWGASAKQYLELYRRLKKKPATENGG